MCGASGESISSCSSITPKPGRSWRLTCCLAETSLEGSRAQDRSEVVTASLHAVSSTMPFASGTGFHAPAWHLIGLGDWRCFREHQSLVHIEVGTQWVLRPLCMQGSVSGHQGLSWCRAGPAGAILYWHECGWNEGCQGWLLICLFLCSHCS